MAISPIGDLGIALKADIDDYQKSMATASDLTAGLSGAVRGLSAAVRNMGAAMTAASAIAGAAMFTLSQRAERVNAAFREVDTLVQGAANSQEKYGQLTSDLNTEMGLQADRLEVIEGLYQSISAGIGQSTEAQREFLTTASQLAVVGRVELGTAVDVLSTVMNTYSLEAEQAQDVSESLFQTVQFGKTRLEDLAPVLGRVAALGSNLSIQIDEIGAAMGVLTRTGFGARVAATGLRNIFRAMMRPSETMQEMLRGIALEQDFFASQMGESEDQVRELANEYREATSALEEWTQKQQEARNTQEEASLAIQEARLKITAIEEERLDQLPELTNETVANAESVEELESIIDDYQFQVNKARIEEENARMEREEKEEQLQNIRDEFKETISVQGDLEGGIGNLVLQNQDFVDTLVQLRQRADDQNVAFNELFPRTRALQGALALVGDDGQSLINIFEQMEEGTFDARDAWNDLDESAKENFDSFEEFQEVTEDVTSGDLDEWFEQARGPQQKLRDSISQLQESLAAIGRVFTEDLTDSIATFAENFNNLVERFSNMEETVRENISEFIVLATTIGLVLGPLLFFGGQLALIAQAMGTSLIPFAILSGSAIGILASAFSTAASGGEEAQTMFEEMRSFLTGLVDAVNYLRRVFVEETLPGMMTAGEGVVDVFSAIFDELTDGTSDGGSLIRQFASLWGDKFALIGNFLSENADKIAKFVGIIVDGFINKVVPAVVRFGNKFIDDILPKIVGFIRSDVIPIIREFGQTFFNDILPSIISIAKDLVKFIKSSVIPVLQNAWKVFRSDVLPWVRDFLEGDLIPSMQSLVQGVSDVVQSFIKLSKNIPIETIIDFLQEGAVKLLRGITDLIDTIGNFLSENDRLVASLLLLISVATPIFIALSEIVSVALALGPIIKGLAALFLTLGGPITIVIGLISLLAAAFLTDFMGIRTATVNLWETVKSAFKGIQRWVGNVAQRVAPYFNSFVNLVQQLWKTFAHWANVLRAVLSPGIEFTIGVVKLLFRLLMRFLKPVFLVGQAIMSLWKNNIQVAFSASKKIVMAVIGLFVRQFKRFMSWILVLMDTISALLRVFRGDFSAMSKVISGFVKLAQIMFAGLVDWLSTGWDIVGVVIDALIKMGIGAIKIILSTIAAIVKSFLNLPGDIASALIEAAGDLIGGLNEIKNTVFSAIDDLLSEVYERAKSIPEQVGQGIKDGLGAVKDAAKNMAGEIRDRLPFSPAPKGPLSKPGPKGHGKTIASDTAEGIRENKDEVAKSAEEVADEYDVETEEEWQSIIEDQDLSFDSNDISFSPDEDSEYGVDTSSVYGDDGIPKDDSEYLPETGNGELPYGEDVGQNVGTGGGTKIIVDEHAVYFEEGAFQGVSDEELPEKVRETVDDSMEEIVDEMEGAGRAAIEHL